MIRTVLTLLSITFISLTISCDNQSASDKAIADYFKRNEIPSENTLYIANGLGCYHCNKKVLESFSHFHSESPKHTLITCDSNYFQRRERQILRKLDNVFVDESNMIQKLNFGTASPTIVDRDSPGQERIIGLNVHNVDSILESHQ